MRDDSRLPRRTWLMAGPPGDETLALPHPPAPEPRQAPGTASGDTWPTAAPHDRGREPHGPRQSHSLSGEGRSRDHAGGGRPRAPRSFEDCPGPRALGPSHHHLPVPVPAQCLRPAWRGRTPTMCSPISVTPRVARNSSSLWVIAAQTHHTLCRAHC